MVHGLLVVGFLAVDAAVFVVVVDVQVELVVVVCVVQVVLEC